MALDTFVPPIAPSPGTKYNPTIRVKKAEFGDGYTAEMPDGSNHIQRKADLTWDSLLEAQADTIIAFLEAHCGGTAFYYALRDGVVRRWKCDVFSRTWQTPNQVTATLEQYFGLEM
jgi:phage-related protein